MCATASDYSTGFACLHQHPCAKPLSLTTPLALSNDPLCKFLLSAQTSLPSNLWCTAHAAALMPASSIQPSGSDWLPIFSIQTSVRQQPNLERMGASFAAAFNPAREALRPRFCLLSWQGPFYALPSAVAVVVVRVVAGIPAPVSAPYLSYGELALHNLKCGELALHNLSVVS